MTLRTEQVLPFKASENGDLKLETKLLKYSQIWAANWNWKLRHFRYRMLIPSSCFFLLMLRKSLFPNNRNVKVCFCLFLCFIRNLNNKITEQSQYIYIFFLIPNFTQSLDMCGHYLRCVKTPQHSHLLKVWLGPYFFQIHLPIGNCLYSVQMSGP